MAMRFQYGGRRENQSGIALVVVLWVVFLLAIMVQSFSADVKTNLQITRNLVENGQARAMADGAVHRAIDILIRKRKERTPVFDAQPLQMTGPEGSIEVDIQDEAGRIDLNTAPNALLAGLFRSVGVLEDKAKSLVDAIADWRDPDSLRRLHGAEDSDYRQANLRYWAKDRPFESVDELMLVLGMTPDIFEAVAPALTVFSGKRGIDVRAAPVQALRALAPHDPDGVSRFLGARRGLETAALNSAFRDLRISRRFISTSSRVTFSIRATARTKTGAVFVRGAVVRLTPRGKLPYIILDWR